MEWANSLLSVDVRNPQSDTYNRATITFAEWHARITSRARALLDAVQTMQAADNAYRLLLAQEVPMSNPLMTGADLETYMRGVEQLEVSRGLAKAALDNEIAVVRSLQNELFRLANIRAYKGSRQPAIWIDLDGIPYLVIVHSGGEIDVVPYDASAPLPMPR